MQRGFYIGRFQPYHKGHHSVVESIAADVDELVVAIGSADVSHTVRNPFTGGERHVMLTKALETVAIPTYVVPLEDIDRNAVWVSHVESLCPPFDVAYSNNPLVVQLFHEAGVEVKNPPLVNRDEYRGTDIRRQMIDGEDWTPPVPDAVETVVDRVNGVERLQRLAADDADISSQD